MKTALASLAILLIGFNAYAEEVSPTEMKQIESQLDLYEKAARKKEFIKVASFMYEKDLIRFKKAIIEILPLVENSKDDIKTAFENFYGRKLTVDYLTKLSPQEFYGAFLGGGIKFSIPEHTSEIKTADKNANIYTVDIIFHFSIDGRTVSKNQINSLIKTDTGFWMRIPERMFEKISRFKSLYKYKKLTGR